MVLNMRHLAITNCCRYDEAETRDLAPYNGYTEPQSAFDIYKQQSLQRYPLDYIT